MTTHAPVPEWLAAWRERKGMSAPEPPAAAPMAMEQSATAPPRRTNSQGFIEPRAWAPDDGSRREPVMDADHNPPRVVRYVGWLRCLRCRRPHFSPDVARVRICTTCKEAI